MGCAPLSVAYKCSLAVCVNPRVAALLIGAVSFAAAPTQISYHGHCPAARSHPPWPPCADAPGTAALCSILTISEARLRADRRPASRQRNQIINVKMHRSVLQTASTHKIAVEHSQARGSHD